MKANELINESSQYLRQHAYNPVQWLPWGDKALALAQKEDKPLLISIGYAACHWCHVMEKESFEDNDTAQLMNRNFICVKVDREERPDVDQLYMTAVQLMTGRGGWPLNCFAMPDGRPFYGGTYFPNETWQNILFQLNHLYRNERERVEEYATSLSNGIQKHELLKVNTVPGETLEQAPMNDAVNRWMQTADLQYGGMQGAPKFLMPNNYLFLLRYAWIIKDKHILDFTHLTLQKIAFGGIYDHLGGGFARYSTDTFWKVPHFEKMLYDNAQMISLYAEAWQQQAKPLYKEICEETAQFIARELCHENTWFYSSIDADSEGVEGLFYTWNKEELAEVLEPEEYQLCNRYFSLNEYGYWENERYILLRHTDEKQIAAEMNISLEQLHTQVQKLKAKLLKQRSTRTRPGLDNKLVVSWNALAIRAFADMHRIFDDEHRFELATKTAHYILTNLRNRHGHLMHTPTIEGFLEDYAMMIDACIALYQASFDETWLLEAQSLCKIAVEVFLDNESGFFWFNRKEHNLPLSRLMEVSDNVIAASNSMMALNLYKLGILFENNQWFQLAKKMLAKISPQLLQMPQSYSNWGILALSTSFPSFELVVSGQEAQTNLKHFRRQYSPDVLLAGSTTDSQLPFMQGKTGKDNRFFVCTGQQCLSPFDKVQAVEQILNEYRAGRSA